MKNTKLVLFDAANTLIYKPQLFEKLNAVLKSHHYNIPLDTIKKQHKLLSEIINFPDITSKSFYQEFNAELLISLGIIPSESLLDDIFVACTYLDWKAFDDTQYIVDLPKRKAVLSNFNSQLDTLLGSLIGEHIFSDIIISEIENVRKPSIEFYELAVEKLQVAPNEILYIGDSLKLDIIPAQKVGMRTLLIDREQHFPFAENRIDSFEEIKQYL